MPCLPRPVWTRKYAIHTSPNFERSKDQKIVAKLLVTCEVTVFGLGSHSATGEEWADDENALTSAEAQSFKRAARVLGSAAISTISPEPGWTWTNTNDPKQFRNSRDEPWRPPCSFPARTLNSARDPSEPPPRPELRQMWRHRRRAGHVGLQDDAREQHEGGEKNG